METVYIILFFICCMCMSSLAAGVLFLLHQKSSTHTGDKSSGSGTESSSHTGSVPIESGSFEKTWGGKPKGGWSVKNGYLEIKHQKNNAGSDAGGTFDTNPKKMFPKDSCKVTYDVKMPSGWTPVKGGKLPGFCLGLKQGDCSNGGEWKKDQGSIRPMWQRDGKAILYVYLTTGDSKKGYDMQGSDYKKAVPKAAETGHGLWHDPKFKFKEGWNTVSIEVKMNDVGKKNGVLGLTINGYSKKLTDVILRQNKDVKITSFRMTSFYGGSDASWAPKTDQIMQFKNFRFE